MNTVESEPEEHPISPPEAQPGGESLGTIVRELLDRERLAVFGFALVIEFVIFFGSMLVPMSPSQQQAVLNQANTLIGATKNQSAIVIFSVIVLNNARVALMDMVPAAGAALFLGSIYVTGQAVQAEALAAHLPGVLVGALLFLFPFALLEFSAYAIGVASGTMLIVAWQKRRLGREIRVFALELVAVIGCVLLAGAMETVGEVAPLAGLALWLPMVGVVLMLALTARDVRR